MYRRIGVDADETLWGLLHTFLAHMNSKNGTNYTIEQFNTFKWDKVFNIPLEQFRNDYFEFHQIGKGYEVEPFADAYQVLTELKRELNLTFVLITARGEELKEEAQYLADKHFPGIFETIYCGDSFGYATYSKAEVCKEAKVDLLIDDQPRYVIDCAKNGILSLLYGEYAWHGEFEVNHQQIIPVKNWSEVKREVKQFYVDRTPLKTENLSYTAR